jgi:hypothetical protein
MSRRKNDIIVTRILDCTVLDKIEPMAYNNPAQIFTIYAEN